MLNRFPYPAEQQQFYHERMSPSRKPFSDVAAVVTVKEVQQEDSRRLSVSFSPPRPLI